jgi:hypothetical protein
MENSINQIATRKFQYHFIAGVAKKTLDNFTAVHNIADLRLESTGHIEPQTKLTE